MRIGVFAGSRSGIYGEYQAAAESLAHELARREIGLVYGGGKHGLMGILANALLADGGEVIGVVPFAAPWEPEENHSQLSRLILTSGMHERKGVMASLADAFIALPGGLGTYDELFEVLCGSALGLHQKPIGLLNVLGYFDPLRTVLEQISFQGFVPTVPTIHSHEESTLLLDQLVKSLPPPIGER